MTLPGPRTFVRSGNLKLRYDRAKGDGWTLEGARFDWATLREAKEREITRLEGIYARNLAASQQSSDIGGRRFSRVGSAGPGRDVSKPTVA